MNGIHDMGGLHGFGAVVVEKEEPVFHARWESRVYAMTQQLDTRGVYSLDEHRHEIELMDTPSYLLDGYYGRWLFAMEHILERKGILKREEVEHRLAELQRDAPVFDKPAPGRNWPLPAAELTPWGAWRKDQDPAIVPQFGVGQRVRVRNLHPEGHTRLTAYIRGKVGVVSIVNAQAWVLPDTRAHNRGENLQPVYNVEFSAQEVWGPQAEPNVTVRVDLMQDYLEAAE